MFAICIDESVFLGVYMCIKIICDRSSSIVAEWLCSGVYKLKVPGSNPRHQKFEKPAIYNTRNFKVTRRFKEGGHLSPPPFCGFDTRCHRVLFSLSTLLVTQGPALGDWTGS